MKKPKTEYKNLQISEDLHVKLLKLKPVTDSKGKKIFLRDWVNNDIMPELLKARELSK